MRAIILVAGMFGIMGAGVGPACAQLHHTWISSTGSDAASCDRLAPCATFGGAFAKTTAGGEITCVDSGNFQGVNITKSITINCENAIAANTPAGGGTYTFIIVNAAATDIITLRGLDFDGHGESCGGTCGLIQFTGAGALHVDKLKINNARTNASGIRFVPTGTAQLMVSDSHIADNGSSGISGGILIQPAAGVLVDVMIDRSRVTNNLFGIIADGTAGGTIHGVISDSVVSNNVNNGITVTTVSTNVVLSVDNTKVSGNKFGLAASGANAGMLVGRSVISANNTGLFTASGAALLSYRDNRLNANTSDGSFTGTVGVQ